MLKTTDPTFDRLRRFLIPKLGYFINIWNEVCHDDLYVRGHTNGKQEFVGRVQMTELEFEHVLDAMGFEQNPLSSLKRLLQTGELEEGSYRWLGTQQVSWTADYADDHQLHVVLYDGSMVPDADTGEVYVYAHWEYRWDTDPVKHYQADGIDFESGVRMMQMFLDSHDVSYDDQYPDTTQ